jgi:hypothetical protein
MFELEMEQHGHIFGSDKPPDSILDASCVDYHGIFYRLNGDPTAEVTEPAVEVVRRFLLKNFITKLGSKGFVFRKRGMPSVTWRKADEVAQQHSDFLRVFHGFDFRVISIDGAYLLCLNPHVVIDAVASLNDYLERGISLSELSGFSVKFDAEEETGIDAYLIETIQETAGASCNVKEYRTGTESHLAATKVKPESRPELLQSLGEGIHLDFGIVRLQRKLSYQDSPVPSRERYARTIEIAKTLAREIFPLDFAGFKITMSVNPVSVII